MHQTPSPFTTQSARPSHGSRIVFFSGGTALGAVARSLTQYTHNAVYIMTPFDSGGSSAILRDTFTMPAIGDFRARLISLANPAMTGYAETIACMSTRFSQTLPNEILQQNLYDLANNTHPRIKAVPEPQHSIFLTYLQHVYETMPLGMSLSNASIGNLILTGAYLKHKRQLERVIQEFSVLLQAQGTIQTVATSEDAHLCVRLANNHYCLGQHSFTGKHTTSITTPIQDIWLTQSLTDTTPVRVHMANAVADLLANADLICYPIGSFYSSVIANLLPYGVSQALCKAPCPKVYIPNICNDPELFGQSLQAQLITLLAHAKADNNTPTQAALNTVLIDTDTSRYAGDIPHHWLAEHGIDICQTQIVSDMSAPYIDAHKVCEALTRLIR